MKPGRFDYTKPETLDQALALLAAHSGDARPIAGGQSLMPMLAFRLAAPSLLIDILGLTELRHIRIDENGLHLGALTRWRDIERDHALKAYHPLLHAAIEHVAHYPIRNRGTVGGSLAHADPAAELPGLAVACDAKLTLARRTDHRVVDAADFFISALVTDLAPDELVTAISFPHWKPGRRWAFDEFARRKGDFAIAGVAVFYDLDAEGYARDVHVGTFGVGERPLRLGAAEAALEGRTVDAQSITDVAAAARDAVQPEDDIHASGAYRRALLGTLTARALGRAADMTVCDAA